MTHFGPFRCDQERDGHLFRAGEWQAIEDGTHLRHGPTGLVFVIDMAGWGDMYSTLKPGPIRISEPDLIENLGRAALLAFEHNTRLFVDNCNRRIRNTLFRARAEKKKGTPLRACVFPEEND